MHRVHSLSIALGVLVFILALPAGSHAEEAHTVPVSDTLITLEVTLPDGESLQATVREGGMVRIEQEAEGVIWGLSPHVAEGASTSAEVKVFEIREVSPGNESIRILETLDVSEDASLSTQKTGQGTQLALEVVAVEPQE